MRPGRFRPIIVTSLILRVYSEYARVHLQEIVDKLPDYQQGFRTGGQMSVLVQQVTRALENNQEAYFIDIKDAFDSMSWRKIAAVEELVGGTSQRIMRILRQNIVLSDSVVEYKV